MPVSIKWAGRLGNAVIKYAVGRLVAENNDMELQTPWPWPHFVPVTPCASGANEAGKTFKQTILLDDDNLPNMTPGFYKDASIVMDGYMQHHHLLWPYRERIRSFFRYPCPSSDRPLSEVPCWPEDLGIHVRLTDGASLGGLSHIVHPDWYDKILSTEARKYRRIIVITDDPAARNMFTVFEKYGAQVKSRTVPEDYFELMQFRDIILGPSTFSWTSAFLGHAKKVWMHDPFITLPNVKLDWPGAIKVRGGFINGRCL